MKRKAINPVIDEITEKILENYNPVTSSDLSMAMKEVFQNTIQKMMNKEFDNFMGYEKTTIKFKKKITEMVFLRKMLIVNMVKWKLTFQEIVKQNLNL